MTESSERDLQFDFVGALERFGLDERALDDIRDEVVQAIRGRLNEADIEEWFDRGKDAAFDALLKVRDYSSRHPALFYGGLAVTGIGLGMIAAAAREFVDEELGVDRFEYEEE
jgi:hypothetical protein